MGVGECGVVCRNGVPCAVLCRLLETTLNLNGVCETVRWGGGVRARPEMRKMLLNRTNRRTFTATGCLAKHPLPRSGAHQRVSRLPPPSITPPPPSLYRVWNSKGVRCKDLVGHSGSVSCVGSTQSGSLVISAAYDKTVRIWDARWVDFAVRFCACRAPPRRWMCLRARGCACVPANSVDRAQALDEHGCARA